MTDVTLKHKLIAGGITALVLAGGGLVLTRCADGEEYKSSLPVEKLTIETAAGQKAGFDVEIAATPIDLHVGLMFRKEMAKDHGMLFEFGQEPREESFWMKDTLIPLDMLFIAADGKIVTIHENAKPEDVTPISSVEPVTAVLELNGGIAASLHIKVGDKVVHPYFKAEK